MTLGTAPLPQSLPNNARNKLLARMSSSDLAALQPHLQPVELKFRQRLESPSRKIRSAFFIERGLASVVAIGGGDRRQSEVTVVGNEGMTGLPLLLGVDRSPTETFMQVEGAGQSIAAEDLHAAMRASATLTAFMMRYAHVCAIQMAHTALANAQGKLEERLARWLLMAHDRSRADELELTHEFLALMLGVRRPGVTMALHQLEQKALVRTARGSVTVLDRVGLEGCANGLYGTPEAEYDRLIPAA